MSSESNIHNKNITIGVLALQGAFIEHIKIIKQLNINAIAVRLPEDLKKVQGLIIPGGESTVIGRLLHQWGLWDIIRERVAQGTLGVWGTCAGAILLAKEVPNLDVQGLQLMDITVVRNAFGRQKESFIAPIQVQGFQTNAKSTAFPCIFIRAPLITQIGPQVQVMARLADDRIVAAQQDKLLATAFHPELSSDSRFHRYFIKMVSA